MKQIPVRKGNTYELTINGLGHSGEGVGRFEDFTVFVPYALPGETVSVKITEAKKSYAKGKIVKIHTASDSRIKPECGLYYQCGGCQLQHIDYEGQLAAKRQTVLDAVTRIGKLEDVIIHPVLGAKEPWYYRNKMQFPVGSVSGETVIGCYAQGTHEIINTEHCLIQHETNNLIAQKVKKAIDALSISTYDEKTGQGLVRHVLGRVGMHTGEVMVVLVTTAPKIPHQGKLVERLCKEIPGLASIVQNINSKRTNVILGNQTKTLWGQDTITDRLGEFSFHISARSFFQVNTVQAEVLYNKAVEYAGLTGKETVIDAYCGTGTISLFLAKKAGKVYGIEIVEQAIEDAKRNAENNGVNNVEFIAADAIDIMPRFYKEGVRPEVIVVDPPRAGCERLVLETFVKMGPTRIVYVSCNPASLARDLAVLAELGYMTKEIQPVDMFSQTFHVESVALIELEK